MDIAWKAWRATTGWHRPGDPLLLCREPPDPDEGLCGGGLGGPDGGLRHAGDHQLRQRQPGIASSVPVIVYARENNIPQEKLYRALAFSGLLTIHQKEFIGKLSAFCGAVSASCASGAAITYLAGGTVEQIKNTIDNTLANISGIICDGPKPPAPPRLPPVWTRP